MKVTLVHELGSRKEGMDATVEKDGKRTLCKVEWDLCGELEFYAFSGRPVRRLPWRLSDEDVARIRQEHGIYGEPKASKGPAEPKPKEGPPADPRQIDLFGRGRR